MALNVAYSWNGDHRQTPSSNESLFFYGSWEQWWCSDWALGLWSKRSRVRFRVLPLNRIWEIGFLLLPSCNMAEILLKRCKSSIQPTNLLWILIFQTPYEWPRFCRDLPSGHICKASTHANIGWVWLCQPYLVHKDMNQCYIINFPHRDQKHLEKVQECYDSSLKVGIICILDKVFSLFCLFLICQDGFSSSVTQSELCTANGIYWSTIQGKFHPVRFHPLTWGKFKTNWIINFKILL